MKYVIYTRVSKIRKVKNEAGEWVYVENAISHDMQISECVRFVGDAEYVIFSETDVSRDEELDNRPVLNEAIDELKKGDILLVWKSDRLVGATDKMLALTFQVAKKHADIQSVTEPMMYANDPMSKMIRVIASAVAEYEVANIRARVKASLKTKTDRGERVGYVPYGYKAEGKMLAPEPKEQEILELIHTLYVRDRLTLRQLSEFLNNRGIPNRKGYPWSHSSVHRILKTRSRYRKTVLGIDQESPQSQLSQCED